MNWQPINTAPEDERIVFATDGAIFGAAKRWVFVEPETIGYNSFTKRGVGQDTERPNPKAGERKTYYMPVAGWSCWDEDAEWEDGEYEQRGPKLMTATHWAELPKHPLSERDQEFGRLGFDHFPESDTELLTEYRALIARD